MCSGKFSLLAALGRFRLPEVVVCGHLLRQVMAVQQHQRTTFLACGG